MVPYFAQGTVQIDLAFYSVFPNPNLVTPQSQVSVVPQDPQDPQTSYFEF